ncbi:MAG: PAS domain-containing protein [Elusimicrobia bacterium]|nr:PAS domain-containing protein [Elusimicrobiota bacterium]
MSRFRHRLALAFCGLLSLATLATGMLLTRELRRFRVEDLREQLATHCRMAAQQAGKASAARKPDPRLQELSLLQSRALGMRVTMVAADGVVVADSGVPFERLSSLERHHDRPEIYAALRGGQGSSLRHSETLDTDMLYVASSVPGWGAVRVAMPLTEVHGQVAKLRRMVLVVSLGFMLAGVVAALFLARSLSRPLDEIAGVAARLSAGDYAARVPDLPMDEHARLGAALNRLAAQVQGAVADLSLDKAELEAILQSVVEAVVAVDPGGHITAANPAFCGLFDGGAAGLVGRSFVEVVRHPRLAELAASILSGGAAAVEEVSVAADGERLFEAHAVPLRSGERRIGALLVLHDITRLRGLERARREFVANVSHELKTPLTTIRGFAETLLSGGMDDPAHRVEFLETIEKDAERLSALVDDLLELSAIESGRAPLRLSLVDVLEVARETAAGLRFLAERRKISITVQDGGAPPVAADKTRLAQVLRNLLDNAVKYNKEGGSVTVAAETGVEELEVSVADTGPGILAEDLPRIFERFYRVDKARSRELGGTGLGLSIVKHIVEAHGGRVWAENLPKGGAVLRFTLPLRR